MLNIIWQPPQPAELAQSELLRLSKKFIGIRNLMGDARFCGLPNHLLKDVDIQKFWQAIE